jgi:iron complex outermembrane receptor protein
VANVTIQHSVLTDNPSSPASTGKIPVGVPAGMAHLWTSYDFSLGGCDPRCPV